MRGNIPAIGAASLLLCGVIGGLSINAVAARSATAGPGKDSVDARVQRLEDREEIRKLFNNYGHTLDQRDFTAFAEIFAPDAEYVGGGAMGTVKGSKAIGAAVESQMTANPAHLNSPNFHIFFNESIEVDGDRATATSKSAFVVRSDSNKPDIVFLAHYDDTLVRDHGQWKFQRRAVHSDIPAPPHPTNQ